MKAWYHKSQLKCLIQLIELDKMPDVSLREALCYISVAWNSLRLPRSVIVGDILASLPNLQKLERVIQLLTLNLKHSSSPDCVSVAEYLEVDRVVETGETFTDDEIVALVGGNREVTVEESDDDCSETLHVAPTARKPLKQLHCCRHILKVEMTRAAF